MKNGRIMLYSETKEAREEESHKMSREKLEFIKHFISLAGAIYWAETQRNSYFEGFDAATPDLFIISFRKFTRKVKGNAERRWKPYGFNPEKREHWFYIHISDPFERAGHKTIVDCAAACKQFPEKNHMIGYDILTEMYKKLKTFKRAGTLTRPRSRYPKTHPFDPKNHRIRKAKRCLLILD